MAKLNLKGKLVILLLTAVVISLIFKLASNNDNLGHDILELQDIAQHNMGMSGEFQTDDFDPMEFLTTWNFNNLPAEERAKYYKETKRGDGSLLREYWLWSNI